MLNKPDSTTYLTIEELTEIAARKFEHAAALAPCHKKEELVKSAETFRNLAKIRGWLCSELQPPN
jgi:hypothetical protein